MTPDRSGQDGAAERIARQWLARQLVRDGREPELDEGDCTICGTAKGEPHEPTDICGMVANLLAQLAALRAERTWQPIATAPKDGTPFLVSFPARRNIPASVELVACWEEYAEIVSYGEPEADGWQPLPVAPSTEGGE